MHSGGPPFVIAIIAICMTAWVITTWIRARHGYPVTDDWGKTVHKTGLGEDRKIELLVAENERLTGQVGRLEDRLRVLERIATDPATRTATEIERLRDPAN